MYEYGLLPRARRDRLLVEPVGKELLLYDQESHTAHCLNSVAACVWRHGDGERDMAELADLAGVSEGLVARALHELREKNLLEEEPQLAQSTSPSISRREAIGRVARYGAAATAGSMIVSATAATPAMAQLGRKSRMRRRMRRIRRLLPVTDRRPELCVCADGECYSTPTSGPACNTTCVDEGHKRNKFFIEAKVCIK
jgi:hypothetical protein